MKGAFCGADSGIVTSGWVFFISTEGVALAAGAKTEMRAVSFFGPGAAGAPAGIGGVGADTLGTDEGGDAAPDAELPLDGGGGGAARERGGGATRWAGAGGKGVWERGGRGGTGGGTVGERGTASFGCGTPGKVIRVVSPPSLPVVGGWFAGRAGKLIRTVSFLGSLGSAISAQKLGQNVPEIFPFVTS